MYVCPILLEFMKKITLLIFVCFQFLALSAQVKAPKWMDKARKAVVKITTFDQSDKPLKTGIGFFIDENGMAVSDYTLFKNAARATVTTFDGQELPVERIYGANELYDVIRFKVTPPKKIQVLPFPSEPIGTGASAYLLPYSPDKAVKFSVGPVLEVSKVQGTYNYYKIQMPLTATNLSAPILTDKGEVMGLAQVDASGSDNTSYAIAADFANSLKITTSDAINPLYTSIGIRKAWPEEQDQAVVYLYLIASAQDLKTYIESLDDFIATFPNASEGYTQRASYKAHNRFALSPDDAAGQLNLLNSAKEDMETALKLSTEDKGDILYGYAKMIYEVAVTDSTQAANGWTDDAALYMLERAITEKDMPVYRQLQADILFNQGKYDSAYENYIAVCHSDAASPASYYMAAKALGLSSGAQIADIISLLDTAIMKSGTPLPKEAGEFILERINWKQRLQQFESVIEDYNLYYDVMRGDVPDMFYYYREQAKSQLGDWDGAHQDIAFAIQKSPEDVTFYAEQASLYIKQKKYDEALSSLQKAISIDPEFGTCYRLKGVCFQRQDKLNEACEAFHKAQELGDPLASKLIDANCKK